MNVMQGIKSFTDGTDTTNLTINDSINIYDGSKYYGGPKVQKIFWCYTDSSISKKKHHKPQQHGITYKHRETILRQKAIDYKAPLKALVHFPESPFDPFGNEVFWDQKVKTFRLWKWGRYNYDRPRFY
ncbi:MAG: hypothetical protein IPG29_17070 [Sphingobacteriales bacterium]|nr:hypothetical protein [Sphingobacteriales bacterium]